MDFSEDFRIFEDSLYGLKASEQRHARLAYARKLEKLLEENPGSRDLNHLLGICLYHMWEWYEKDKIRIERAFQRSLTLDPGSYYSLEFLGYFYFDIAQYQLSLNCIEALFAHEGKVHIHDVRLFKLDGLRIACQVRLGVIETASLQSALELFVITQSGLDALDQESFHAEEICAALKASSHVEDQNIARLIDILENPVPGPGREY